jgi:hypothetical protein
VASGAGAAEHAAAGLAEGIIAREARAALKEAEQVATHDAVAAAEHDVTGAAEHDVVAATGGETKPPRLDRTEPTAVDGGVPSGRPAAAGRKEGHEGRRGAARENQAASTLAARGYKVHQKPSPTEVANARRATGDLGRVEARPDYLVEGRVFDCYSPGPGTSVRNLGTYVGKKVTDGQTQRVVLNIADWPGGLSELTEQFGRWPIAGLKELLVIQPDGTIVHLFAE